MTKRTAGILAGLACAGCIAVALHSSTAEQRREALEARYRDGLGNLVLLLNEPFEGGRRSLCQRIETSSPHLTRADNTNRGAELLAASFSGMIPPWSADDCDEDGIRELVDPWGDPLILLSPDLPQDVIITPSGRKVVDLPPYCSTGYYVNSLHFHVWSSRHAETWRRYLPETQPETQE